MQKRQQDLTRSKHPDDFSGSTDASVAVVRLAVQRPLGEDTFRRRTERVFLRLTRWGTWIFVLLAVSLALITQFEVDRWWLATGPAIHTEMGRTVTAGGAGALSSFDASSSASATDCSRHVVSLRSHGALRALAVECDECESDDTDLGANLQRWRSRPQLGQFAAADRNGERCHCCAAGIGRNKLPGLS